MQRPAHTGRPADRRPKTAGRRHVPLVPATDVRRRDTTGASGGTATITAPRDDPPKTAGRFPFRASRNDFRRVRPISTSNPAMACQHLPKLHRSHRERPNQHAPNRTTTAHRFRRMRPTADRRRAARDQTANRHARVAANRPPTRRRTTRPARRMLIKSPIGGSTHWCTLKCQGRDILLHPTRSMHAYAGIYLRMVFSRYDGNVIGRSENGQDDRN